MTDITPKMKHAAALRELRMRRKVYPRQVKARRMKQADADHEIAVMQAIADDYAERDLLGGTD